MMTVDTSILHTRIYNLHTEMHTKKNKRKPQIHVYFLLIVYNYFCVHVC